jgi:hypothetical protein
VACGAQGQRCCPNGPDGALGGCNIGLACDGDPTSTSSSCVSCGGPDQACCNGGTCRGGYQCNENKCTCPAPNRAVCSAGGGGGGGGGSTFCVNLQDNIANCGECGNSCFTATSGNDAGPGGSGFEICVAGQCESCGQLGERCCSFSLSTPAGPHVCLATNSRCNTDDTCVAR